MSNRFSEIMNAKWCKICSTNVVDGQPHPNEDAHFEAQLARIKAVESKEAFNQKLTATSSLIPVSSNDMMKHIAQQGSPETLCGRLITDKYRPSTTDLVCDICADLANATSFIIEGEDPNPKGFDVTAMNYTRDGYKIDDDGFTVLTSDSDADLTAFTGFTFEKFVNTSSFETEADILDEEPVEDEIVYLGLQDDEPIQFTAHWLEEDNEEPLFLPNDEL